MRLAMGTALIDQRGESASGATPGFPEDQGYIGLSPTNNPASVDFSTFGFGEVLGQTSFTAFGGVSNASDFLIILVPATFVVQHIFPTGFPLLNELAGYTFTADVRQINAINFSSYVLGPLNPNLSFTRTVSSVAP